jgi:hypothetical protein
MWHAPRFPGRILFSPRDRGPTGSRRSSHRRRSAVFRLERLEERTVLSTLTVLNNLDSGLGSLRDTIAAANPGDTIEFAKDVHRITLTSGELVIDKNLDIEGSGPNTLTISGNSASRVFDITSPNAEVTIAGMTITDGLADGDSPVFGDEGGGVLNQGTLTLFNDVLSNNQALGQNSGSHPLSLGRAIGGGVANLGPELDVKACQFFNNQARGADAPENAPSGFLAGSGAGGAIGNPPSPFNPLVPDSVSVTDSLFAGNVARGGSGWTGPSAGTGLGGCISNGGSLSVEHSIFTANEAIGGNDNTGSAAGGGTGGAISSGASVGTQSLMVSDGSIFDGNQAVGGNGNGGDSPNAGAGGAITVLKGSGEISGSTLDHNLALGGQGADGSSGGNGAGGGLFSFAHGGPSSPVSVTVSNSTVDYNAAIGGPGGSGGSGGNGLGGGLATAPGATLAVSSTTVNHNMAGGGHGGAGGNGGNGYGGGLYNDISSTLTLTGATVEYNLALGGGNGGLGVGGGVYNLGAFAFDPTTVIKKNHASTSNDDIFP